MYGVCYIQMRNPNFSVIFITFATFYAGICGEAVQEAGGSHREVRGEGDAAGARLSAHG
jgi:hypothetical protein